MYSLLTFLDNISVVDLADMHIISKFNNGSPWAISLKDKGGTTITNPFQKILDESIANRTKYG